MKRMWIVPALSLVLIAGAYAAGRPRTAAQVPAKPDWEAVAERLTSQCAGIREGDLLAIVGGPHDLELLENIASQAGKRGAFPMLLMGSDRLTRRMFDDVPAQYDTRAPAWDMKLAENATAWITVDYNENPGLIAHVSPDRVFARSKAAQPVTDLMLKRGVRQVNLGNGLYPTAARARQLGLTQDQLARIFWDGINVDYAQLQAAGDAMKRIFEGGREVHITNSNGTDLRMRIETRPVFVSDGSISPDDERRGGAACQVWLPAGEVYLTPVPGTAQGTVVMDRHFYQDKEILGLKLTFKDGKLTTMSAKSGIEPLRAMYDVAGPGRDEFALIDIGINPNVAAPTGGKLLTWVPAGMLSVGFGSNEWAGGANNASFSLIGFVPGSTVTVDGKAVVEQGALAGALAAE